MERSKIDARSARQVEPNYKAWRSFEQGPLPRMKVQQKQWPISKCFRDDAAYFPDAHYEHTRTIGCSRKRAEVPSLCFKPNDWKLNHPVASCGVPFHLSPERLGLDRKAHLGSRYS
ncbi:hypothetical protein ASPBRDRAFT_370769 [Aspergillus brasiliensis CBS 101740]|uniref:Uncharacterized protein n=1 Tax=Aspergillus brasiliensis (strain CBS 101740 / IMI 381727 / IBT 21946) TaxID=767769 RepID=A0A1L9UUS0_ASPBC|nr:hypothetical protein ASPBRDRAFT_370769 [Aspergillus brasiliensis CBS 101740]